ncbi:MAG: CotH kinase family protein [Muribaculaceae bacterium]
MRCLVLIAIFLNVAMAMAQSQPKELPSVEINTPEGRAIQRHEWWQGTHISIKSADGDILYSCDSIAIKGRGNSTWSKEKKPYVFRLPQNESLLGMPSHTEWFLLANVMDHSHLRNALTFEISRITSLDWTPHGTFVELTLNGEYKGLYYLCESIAVAPTRMRNDDCAVIIEMDSYKKGGVEVTLADGEHPEDWRSVVRQQSLSLDTLSLVDWIIVNELVMNAEAYGPRSCYLHISPAGALKAGPVWDYDLAFNDVGIDADRNLCPTRFKGKRQSVEWLDVTSSFCFDSGYIETLQSLGFKIPTKEELMPLLAARWQQLRPAMQKLTTFVEQMDRAISRAAIHDQEMWNAADPARFDPSTSYQDAINRLLDTYKNRLEQMDKLFEE